MKKNKIQKIVEEAYSKIAQGKEGCGCGTCGPDTKEFAKSIGYSEDELKAIPEEANLALGCGNPTALASLKEGEVVLDLGCGAGFDCFLSASKVGANGKVIGVDMTHEMIEKARDNAKKNGISNVEFRLGEIENLPVADNSVDVVISNCVINLSADKPKVFQEVYRVLKPGGRIAVSDIALLKELPKKIQESIEAYVGCVAGAILVDEYKRVVEKAGLKNVKVTIKALISTPLSCFA
ncbi:MAG: arsenite methyltransferase [bacterium]